MRPLNFIPKSSISKLLRTANLVIAKAANKKQMESIGNQTGARVFLFLFTDDFWRDYNEMLSKDIHFVREPKNEDYGTVAVFEDLYGILFSQIKKIKA